MKKIEFGFNDDDRLNGLWSGIEFYNGEYLDMFNYEGMDFLVTEVVDSTRGLNGNIDVREIAQDYYADGSYITYANKVKNTTCKKFEELLNSRKMKERINDGKSPMRLLGDEGLIVYRSHLLDVAPKSENISTVLTSVRPDVFAKLKESKKYSRGRSMYDMVMELQKLRKQLQELKDNNSREIPSRHF